MTTVSDLIRQKGSELHTITEDATVFEAIQQMVDHNIGCLLVCGPDRVPQGIISERDLLKRVALQGRSSKTTRVDEIMTRELVAVEVWTRSSECMDLMTEHRIRHLPVVSEKGVAVGMLSIGDFVKNLVLTQESEIRELTAYIQGQYG